MNIDQAINLINQLFNITLSPEQEAVLRAPVNAPLLVNACAGSGKTTLYLYSIITRALIGVQNPANVLGITFSKKAQLNMSKKYDDDIAVLGTNQSTKNATLWGKPMFATFHALFFRLLRTLPEYQYAHVLEGYGKFFYQLSKQLDMSETDLSKQDYLTQIFDAQSVLINMTYSNNGLDLNYNNDVVQLYQEEKKATLENVIKASIRSTMDTKFIENYQRVIELYQALKRENGYIDFSDMKVQLLNILNNNPKERQIIQQKMQYFNQIYIDEFQDIDPLQWQILTKMVPTDVMNRLFVIGDDDQSIYAFRGSSPYFILNFSSTLLPNANTLNLSTNYRTEGNILNIARPFIHINTARLPKDLYSANQGRGKIYIYTGADINTNSGFFAKLGEKIKDTHGNTALLVRLNKDKTLISDKLATNGYYTNVTQKSLILQNQIVYKTIVNLIDSLLRNDVRQFIQYSDKIGFATLKQALENCYEKDMTFADLFEKAPESINTLRIANNNPRLDWRFEKAERQLNEVKNAYERLQDNLKSEYTKKFDQSSWLCENVKDWIQPYIKFMIGKQIFSKRATEETENYIIKRIQLIENWNKFLNQEDIKRRGMEQMIDAKVQLPNFQIMSMHQAKGLEFDDVFIYGLGDELVKKELYTIWQFIPAKMALKDFAGWLYDKWHDEDYDFIKLLYRLFNQGNNVAMNILGKMIHLDPKEKAFNDTLQHYITKEMYNVFDYTGIMLSDHEIKSLYHDAHNISAFIEEERRLLYVAMTRAKQNAYLGYPSDHVNPLATEILNVITNNQEKDKGEGVVVENNNTNEYDNDLHHW